MEEGKVTSSHYQKYKDTIRKYQEKHKAEIAAYYYNKNQAKKAVREKEFVKQYIEKLIQ